MRRVDARRDHAEVIECVPFGDRPDIHLVAESMGKSVLPLPVDLHLEVAVSVGPDGAGPQPAVGLVSDLAAEPLLDVLRLWSHGHNRNHTTNYTEWIGTQLLAHLEVAA
jgi:hypothetical protein